MHQATAPPAQPAALDPSDWEGPARRQAPPGAAPVLAIDGFEGPLDWLLELARTRRIDLARLSIAALVDAFAAALSAALADADPSATTLARWSDWLVMAADLILLRSRLLLPAPPAAARDAAEALRHRLLTRAQAVAAAEWLERRHLLGRYVFRRGQAVDTSAIKAGRVGDATALLRACLVAIRLPDDAAERYRVPRPPFWSPADAAARIRALLPAMGEGGLALKALLPGLSAAVPERARRCREAVASTFGAGLEMAREGDLTLDQEAAWAPIQVRRGQERCSDTGELVADVRRRRGRRVLITSGARCGSPELCLSRPPIPDV